MSDNVGVAFLAGLFIGGVFGWIIGSSKKSSDEISISAEDGIKIKGNSWLLPCLIL
jgi:hypothetical protein